MANRTWTNKPGDWSTATLWNPGTVPTAADTAIFSGTPGYIATIGPGESFAVAGVTLADSAAELQIATGSTLTTSGSFALQAGSLYLSGVLAGGTLVGAGGTILAEGGTLSHETIAGSVTATGFFTTLDITGGLAFAAGGAASLVFAGGGEEELLFLDGETLAGGTIRFNDSGATLAGSTAPLTFGAGFTLDIESTDTLDGSIVNKGTILVGMRGVLDVADATLGGTGSIILEQGATLELGLVTTAQALALAGSLTALGGVIDIATLDNTGTVLDLTGSLATELHVGTLVGGTLLEPATVTGAAPFFTGLSGVTVNGPLNLIDDFVDISGGLTLHGAGGTGPGSIVLGESSIFVNDSETLDNATLLVGSNSFSSQIQGPIDGTLTLGSGLSIAVGATASLYVEEFEGGLVNHAAISVGTDSELALEFDGSFTNTGVISLGADAILLIDGTLTTGQLLADLAGVTGPGTIELEGTLENTGSTLALPQSLIIAADIVGGVVVNTGGVTFRTATLDDVTMRGPLNVDTTTGSILDIVDGITLQSLAGTPGGTIALRGYDDSIVVDSTQAIADAVILMSGGDGQITGETGTLAFTADDTIIVSSGTAQFESHNDYGQLVGTTIVNAGTIVLAAPDGTLDLLTTTLFNDGSIGIPSGATLRLGVNTGTSLFVGGTGTLALASGATLAIGARETTAQLLDVIGTTAQVVVDARGGTIVNTGASLVVGATSPITALALATDLVGGVVVTNGSVAATGGTLDGVTFQGVLTTGTLSEDLTIRDGLTLLTASGAAGGTLEVTGANQILEVADNTAFTNGVFNLGNSGDDIESFATVLAFGSGATLDVAPLGVVSAASATLLAPTLTNAGTMLVAAGSDLNLAATTINNTGTVSVGAGGTLGLEVGASGRLSLGSTAGFELAAGATLATGGTVTTAQLLGVVNNQAGVTLALGGTVINTGTSLVAGSASLPTVQLGQGGDLVGGVLVPGTGLAVAGGTLAGVTVQGLLAVGNTAAANGSATLNITGGLTLQSAAGATGGTIDLLGPASGLAVRDAETLLNATVVATGPINTISSATSLLSLGASFTLDALGTNDLLIATSIGNAGSLVVEPGAGLFLDSTNLINSGTISVAAGATIGIAAASPTQAVAGTLSIGTGGVPHTGGGSAFGLSMASGSTLDVGGVVTTGQLIGLIGSSTTGVVVHDIGTIINTGTTLTSTASGPFSNLLLGGTVIGGTIANRGGTLTLGGTRSNVTLSGVTFAGPLDLGASVTLDVTGGLSLLSATGPSTLGTIVASGPTDSLIFQDAETLTNVIVSAPTTALTIGATVPVLALGAAATLAAGHGLTLAGTTVSNAGTIIASGTTASIDITGGTLINSGLISVAAGGTLALDQGSYAGGGDQLAITNTGSISIGSGSTLVLGSTETTQQLLALLGSLGGTDLTVDITGTLINTGAALDVESTGVLSSLVLDGDVVGGTVIAGTGSLLVAGGTLDGVTVQGPLTLSGEFANIGLKDGLTLLGSGGTGPGTLDVTGGSASLSILDNRTTLSAATINVADTSALAISASDSPLAIGTGITLADFGSVQFASATSISSAATITVTGHSFYGSPEPALLAFNAPTIVNTGSIHITSTGQLGLDPSSIGYGATKTLDVVNAGSITIDPGAELEVGGVQSTAQLISLVNGISQPGVTLDLLGTLANDSQVLALGQGVFDDVLLAGTIIGGTLDTPPVGSAGSVAYRDAFFETLTVDGPLNLGTSSYVGIGGSLTVNTAAGVGPGTITMAGGNNRLRFTDQGETLDNVDILASGFGESVQTAGSFTLGAGVSLGVGGNITFSGGYSYGSTSSPFVNAGTIAVSGIFAGLFLNETTVVNTGVISIASGGTLSLALGTAAAGHDLPFFNSGLVTIGTNAALAIGGVKNDAQLLDLLGSISNPGVEVFVQGTLINTGSVFSSTAGGLLNDVALDGDIVGGTVTPGSGILSFDGGTFDHVAYQGTLGIGSRTLLDIVDGITLSGVGGTGLGTIDVSGFSSGISFLDAETLSNAALLFTGSTEQLGFGTLTLAASSSVNVSGTVSLSGSALVNNAPITTSGSLASISITTNTFVNNALISIGAGDVLGLSTSGTNAINISGTGSIALAPGSTLAIGGNETQAQLLALIGSIVGTQTGVTIELDGVIQNAGSVLDFGPTGPLSNVVLDADVVGGTIVNGGGTLSVIGGQFQTVTFQGPLVALASSAENLFVTGGLVLENLDGSLPGTLVTAGTLDMLSILDGGNAGTLSTLSNVDIVGNGQTYVIFGPEIANGTLDIAASATFAPSGVIGVFAETIDNAGTALLTAPNALLGFEAADFNNTGTIVVGAGAGVGFSFTGTTVGFSNQGSIEIASGATLGFGGSLTTAQFEQLFTSIATVAGVTAAFGLQSDLDNTNATLLVGGGAPFDTMLLGLGGIFGGTIVNDGSFNFALRDQLADTTFIGPVTLAAPATSLAFEGATTLTGLNGAQDLIAAVGTRDALLFEPGNTLDIPGSTGAVSQSLDNAMVVLGMPTVQANGVDLVVSGGGTVTFGAATTLLMNPHSYLSVSPLYGVNSTFINQGTILTTPGVEISGNVISQELSQLSGEPAGVGVVVNNGVILASAGAVTVPAGGSVLSIYGSFINNGTIAVGGTVSVTELGEVTNAGEISLARGATLALSSAVDAAGTVLMADGAETIQFGDTLDMTVSLVNFNGADRVDFADISFDASTLTGTLANGIFDVVQNGATVAAVSLPSFAGGNADLTLQTDGVAGTQLVTDIGTITVPPPCFAAGTRLRLADGGVAAVEELSVGTMLATLSGVARPVRWVGQRQVDCRRHPTPERVQPVRVQCDAFGPGLPARDLVLSPDHSLFVDGVLIPVQHLLNGATITREQVSDVHYFHVELDAHDVVLAEDLPAESYLDTGNRSAFATGGGVTDLHPDFSPRGWADACAPLVQAGPVVAAARARLCARARTLGFRHRRGVAPVLLVNGRQVAASATRGEVYRYLLPADASEVVIVSATGVPAGRRQDAADCRQLGVALGGILLDGVPLELTGPALVSGFYGVEDPDGAVRRWTDGHAMVDLPPCARTRVLELRVVEMMGGWRLVKAA